MDDWQLYESRGCGDRLSQRFEERGKKGATRDEVRNGMRLNDYPNLGAADTEVGYFVEGLLDRHFGDEQ